MLTEITYRNSQVANIPNEKDRLATESGFRQTLVQLVGGAALLGGLYFTAQTLRTSQETLQVNQETLRTSQQGQITERFTKAIEQLGDKVRLMVRLGGIYALERIARDSASDHGAVMAVLTAFVREPPPVQTLPPDKTSEEGLVAEDIPHYRKPPADIQAILTVIGRRTRTLGHGESQSLDLRSTKLQGAALRGAQLQGANLEEARLQGADLRGARLQGAALRGARLQGAALRGAQLQGANLEEARLQGAVLEKAELQGADLSEAQLQEADLSGANLQGAKLQGAKLQGAKLRGAKLQKANLQGTNLQGANLTKAESLTQDQVNTACVDKDTLLPEGLTSPAPCPANP